MSIVEGPTLLDTEADSALADELASAQALTPEEKELVPVLVDVIWDFAGLITGIKLYPYQEEFGRRMIEAVVGNEGDELTALFSRQSGKALSLDTPILSEDGWTTMGDLQVGDRVFGPDGHLTTITATSSVFTGHDCYRLRFSDGQEIVADAEHRWTLWDAQAKGMVTLTTEDLAGMERRFLHNGRSCWRHAVSVPAPLEQPERELPLDPYLLGVWLGDGSSSKSEITSADWECVQPFLDAGYELGYTGVAGGKSITYGFRGGLYKNLCELGLIKVSGRHEGRKHIPQKYLHASQKQRLALLQGMMDSDGHCTNHGEVEFSTTLSEMADDVLFLVRSLGWKATLKEGRATLNGRDCGPKYRVCWTPYTDLNPFRLERKASRVKAPPSQEWRRRRNASIKLVSVQEVPTVPTKCIAVDNESHLYLAGRGLVPTHNTETVACVTIALMVMLPRLAKIERFAHMLKRFERGVLVGTFAPVGSQAATLFERIGERMTSESAKAVLEDPEIDEFVERKMDLYRLGRCGSSVRVQTANPKAKIESKTYHLILIDEAQGADEHVVSKSIGPMGAATNACMIMLGTPAPTLGYFYKTIKRNKRKETERGGKQNHFEYNWRTVAKYNPDYARHVQRTIQAIGSDSDEFRMAFNVEWVLDRGMFTTSSRMDQLADRKMGRVGYWSGHCVMGIDVARKVDSTVATVVWVDYDRPNENGLCHHRILNWLEMPGEDWESQYYRIAEFSRNYNIIAVGVDGGGMGDLVVDRLHHLMPNTNIEALSSSPKEQARRWKYLTALLTGSHEYYGNLLAYPADANVRRTKTWKRFYQQMTELEKKYQGPYLMAEAPNETGAHDDFPDSLALACIMSESETMPEVEVYQHNFIMSG